MTLTCHLNMDFMRKTARVCFLSKSLSKRIITSYVPARTYSFEPKDAVAITYNATGSPANVLELTKVDLPEVGPKDVLIKMLAAPINPSDINMIEGVYPIKPPLPAVGGNEGVGEIIDAGNEVKDFKPGDWVLPKFAGWGTWRTHAVCKASELKPIRNDIPLFGAATIAVNPCTAYRMLEDFVFLEPGDTVIQNGATSSVGQSVIQLAKLRNLHTVNIVREGTSPKMVEKLKNLGATYIVDENFLKSHAMREFFKQSDIPKPKVGFNCVGGPMATEITRLLQDEGALVTYGGMSRQPVTVPTSLLIFKDILLVGFWMSRWNTVHGYDEESQKMLEDLSEMIHQGSFQPPNCQPIYIEDFLQAFDKSVAVQRSGKFVIVMDSVNKWSF